MTLWEQYEEACKKAEDYFRKKEVIKMLKEATPLSSNGFKAAGFEPENWGFESLQG